MQKLILTIDEVRAALYLDADFNSDRLKRYSEYATSFIKQATGYDFANVPEGEEIEPLAKQLAEMYVKQFHFENTAYSKEHDYTIGIGMLVERLQDIAINKVENIVDHESDGWIYE